MMDLTEIEGELRKTDRWVLDTRSTWSMIDGAYSDKFWRSLGVAAGDPLRNNLLTEDGTVGKARVEVNLVKPWTRSFMASLYYQGITTSVSPSGHDKPAKPEEVLAMQQLGNEWLEESGEDEDQVDLATATGLLYEGTGALKVGIDEDEDDPTKAVWFEAVLPNELVFDRDARSWRTLRGMGYVTYLSVEAYRAQFGKEPPAEEITYKPRADGERHLAFEEFEKTYVRVLEWFDRTESPPVRRFFAVKIGSAQSQDPQSCGLVSITESEEVEKWSNGRPMIPLLPIVVDSLPSRPLYNLASVMSLYKLNLELNMLASDMATGYRRSMARVLLYLTQAGVTAKVIAQIEAGVDMVMIALENPEALNGFKFLEQQPMHPDVLSYRKFLMESVPQVQLSSSQSRGTPGQYLSAREVEELSSYTQTMVGEMRSAIDRTVAKLVEARFALISAAMKKSISITLPDRTVVKLTKEMVGRRWKVKVADGAISPNAERQKKGELVQAQPILAAFAGMAADATNPDMAGVGVALYNYFVTLFALPETMRWENLARPEPPPPPPEPEPEPAAPQVAEEAPLDPAIAGTPAGQVVAQALGEG